MWIGEKLGKGEKKEKKRGIDWFLMLSDIGLCITWIGVQIQNDISRYEIHVRVYSVHIRRIRLELPFALLSLVMFIVDNYDYISILKVYVWKRGG